MKTASFLFLLLLVIFSCDDNSKNSTLVCGFYQSATEVPWIKTEINSYESISSDFADYFLHGAHYKGISVFYFDMCCPACDVAPPKVKRCDGSVVGTLGVDVDPNQLLGDTGIWRTHKGACQ